MTIGKRITAACCVLVGLSGVIGAVAVLSIGRISREMNAVVDDSLPATYALGRIDSLQLDLRGATLHHVATSDPKVKAAKDSQSADLASQVPELIKQYEVTIDEEQGRALFQPVPGFLDAYMQACAKVRALSREGKIQEAMQVYDTEGDSSRKRLKDAIKELLQYNQVSAKANAQAARAAAQMGHLVTFLVLGLSLAAGGLLAYFSIRSINATLRRSISELGQGADELTKAAAQVSTASQELAQGASEQAAAIEETSASSQEIATTTHASADSSKTAAGMMEQTRQDVTHANATLDRMLGSMKEITASSEKISKIIRVIDDIAFQTNILALNAAVEAARAGESGMGFAVVSDEVRNLAQRSAQAAKDTAGLIEESINKSGEGRQSLDEVAGAIHRLTENTAKVKALVDQVSATSLEQSHGLGQISKAVAEMETVTQRTASAAEQTASTSQELNAGAESLKKVVLSLQELVGASV